MRTSRKLTHVLFAVVTLVMMSMAALAADPGSPIPATSEASDQKAGSILFYNYYSSDGANTSTKNTQINITNTSSTGPTVVHFYFVDGSSCGVADFKTYLTPSQTETFYTSDFDPDRTGYIMAVAEQISVSPSGFFDNSGLPWYFNNLIGDLYTWDAEKAANLGAVAFSAVWAGGPGTTVPNGLATNSTASFTLGTEYNAPPATLALSNIPSRAAGLRMTLILNQIGGNFLSTTGGGGTLFGLLYDDQEQSQSFSVSVGCQSVNVLSDTYPRTVPRFTTVVSAGRTGWMRLYSQAGTTAILGSSIQWSTLGQVGARGGHNLHALTNDSNGQAITIPVFPY